MDKTARQELQKLIARYNLHKEDKTFLSNEKQVCQHLIVPLIKYVLGWDTEDPSEFHTEEQVQRKRPDYVVLNQGISQFIVEAKAPTTNIFDDETLYAQALEYGYNKTHPFAILTNFRQIVVLDCLSKVKNSREAEIAKIELLTATDEKLGILLNFSKKEWLSTGKERLMALRVRAERRVPVDAQLLEDMKNWRERLLRNLRKNEKQNKIDFGDEEDFLRTEEEVQKIIDRLVFICYCEDKELTEPRLLSLLQQKDDRHAMSPGWLRGKISEAFRDYDRMYDSDLFEKSPCDDFVLDDSEWLAMLKDLRESSLGRPGVNFASIEADILGKVYENFIGHVQTGKKRFKEKEDKGKRKKEGIYYTPKYIVDYIVNNTVREYVKEKDFDEMLKVKIVDPACGSGSFLLRAYDILIEEATKALKRAPTYSEKESLMLSCIHGVDLDRRAVAITKLNLSLKMASRGEKLPKLNQNIKHGNSLIDDEEVAGYDHFRWEEEFPAVFKQGGFDVVIGNPPYVRQEELKEIKPYLESNYEVFSSTADLFVYFFEREIKILRENGSFGMIVSNKWLKAGYGLNLRKFLSKFYIEKFIDFGDLRVFQDATTYPCIITIRNAAKPNLKIIACQPKTLTFDSLERYVQKNSFNVDQQSLNVTSWNFQTKSSNKILEKVKQIGIPLSQYIKPQKEYFGIKTGLTNAFVIDKGTKLKLIKLDPRSSEIIKPFLMGSDVRRYGLTYKDKYIILTKIGVDLKKYPAIHEYLSQFKSELEKRWDKGNYWYELRACDYYDFFDKPKLIYGAITVGPRFFIDTKSYYANNANFFIPTKDLKLLAILNSKLGWFLISNTCTEIRGGYQLIWKYFGNVPIAKTESPELEKLSEKMLQLNEKLLSLEEGKSIDKRAQLKKEITDTDNKIDELVYALYGITPSERKIIEESLR